MNLELTNRAMATLDDSNALLIFRVGPVYCCAPSLPVNAIIQPPHLTHPPGTTQAQPGIFKHGAYIVTVVDLRHRFGVGPVEWAVPGRLTITQLKAGAFGFWVDHIIDVIEMPSQGWGALPPHLPRGVFSRTLLLNDHIHLYADFENLNTIQQTGYLRHYIEHMKQIQQSKQHNALKDNKNASSKRCDSVNTVVTANAENSNAADKQTSTFAGLELKTIQASTKKANPTTTEQIDQHKVTVTDNVSRKISDKPPTPLASPSRDSGVEAHPSTLLPAANANPAGDTASTRSRKTSAKTTGRVSAPVQQQPASVELEHRSSVTAGTTMIGSQTKTSRDNTTNQCQHVVSAENKPAPIDSRAANKISTDPASIIKNRTTVSQTAAIKSEHRQQPPHSTTSFKTHRDPDTSARIDAQTKSNFKQQAVPHTHATRFGSSRQHSPIDKPQTNATSSPDSGAKPIPGNLSHPGNNPEQRQASSHLNSPQTNAFDEESEHSAIGWGLALILLLGLTGGGSYFFIFSDTPPSYRSKSQAVTNSRHVQLTPRPHSTSPITRADPSSQTEAVSMVPDNNTTTSEPSDNTALFEKGRSEVSSKAALTTTVSESLARTSEEQPEKRDPETEHDTHLDTNQNTDSTSEQDMSSDTTTIATSPADAMTNPSGYYASIKKDEKGVTITLMPPRTPEPDAAASIEIAPVNESVPPIPSDTQADEGDITAKPSASDQQALTEVNTEPAKTAPSSENPDSLKAIKNPKVREFIHIVVKGDTLWAIAKRYVHNPFLYPELARLSNIKNPHLIYPGDRVRIIQYTQ